MRRRTLLKLGLAAAAAGCGRRVPPFGAGDCGPPTREDVLGPYYPRWDVAGGDEDTDLTRVAGQVERAQGVLTLVRGRVLDDACQPITGARVELWQANHFGRYRHADADTSLADDPGFQGFGFATTGADGGYGFLTIRPGPYPVLRGGTQLRAPHLHLRTRHADFREDMVQMYFEGEALNGSDYYLSRLPPAEQARVVVAVGPAELRGDDEAAVHRFDIVLARTAS